eukprot:scaffold7805_cov116-Isochrysis_galbana.AAC.4
MLRRFCDVEQELREPALGRHVVLQARTKGGIAQHIGEALAQRLAGARVVGEPQVAQDGGDGVEALSGGAYVGEARLVQQYFLDYERGNRLGEFRPGLHDAQAQWNDLRGEQKVDDVRVVHLDERTDDPKRREP